MSLSLLLLLLSSKMTAAMILRRRVRRIPLTATSNWRADSLGARGTRIKVESLVGGDAVVLAGGGGGDTTRGPHRTLLSGGDCWLPRVDEEVDGRLRASGGLLATSGFTSSIVIAHSTSGARGSLLHSSSGSRLRLASSSRD